MQPWERGVMRGALQSGTARKRAMILRESQNRPMSSISSDRPPNEIAELEKGRMKRECHRASGTVPSQVTPLFSKSAVTRGDENEDLSFVRSARPRSNSSDLEKAHSNKCGERASSPEAISSCDDVFHFTRQITPSVFMKQKLRLELVERDLAVCQEEKRHLQKQLQASLQTAFKLQELIMKQKMVTELEQVVARERGDQAEQIRVERDELKKKLMEAIRAKEEAELTLTLSRDLNVRLFPGTEIADAPEDSAERTSCSLRQATEDEVRLLSSNEQTELLRQKLDETKVEAVIQQTVADCVYAASLRECEAGRAKAIDSMKTQTEELRRKLDEAVRSKEEAALTVTLSRDLNTRLFPGKGKVSKTQDRVLVEEAAPHELERESQRWDRDEEMTSLRQQLDQTRVQAAIYEAVIESVYTGALEASEARRAEACQLSENLAKKIEELNGQIIALEEKLSSCDETVELPSLRPIPPLLQCGQNPLVPGEITTPLKVRSDETPIKFFRSKRVTSKPRPVDPLTGSPWISRSTSLDFCVVAKREAALNANLRKSMQEMEILGDKVEEHKSILEKVTLLLSYISKSGHSASGSKTLAREICDQLERYDGELK